VADAYHELFPRSGLPFVRVLTFWVLLALAAICVLFVVWKRG